MFKAASPMLTRETEASLSSLKPARPYLLLELPFLSPLRRGSTPCFKVRIESLLLSLAQFPQITPFWLAVFLRETQDWRERVLLLQKHSHGGLIISCQQTNRSNFYSNFLPFRDVAPFFDRINLTSVILDNNIFPHLVNFLVCDSLSLHGCL